ncbi:glycosyltransferase family 4 protein [Haladaptatus sp. DYSN1]|uniref:glycosyltransferase family 4 protein n=1 Tax=unclassified Haladaptatus TaxID=2622732 RepID=UPI0024068C23|nr:glycosyltransferase family 4 protein [Haladaptatus sp. DYSN1]
MNFCAVLGTYPKDTPGGAEFQSYLIARELAARGWEAHYVAHQAGETSVETDEGIVVHRLARGTQRTRALLQELRTIDADFYYFRNMADLPLAALAKRAVRGQVVFNISHDRQCDRLFAGWPGQSNRTRFNSLLRRGQLAVYRTLLRVPDQLFVQTRAQQALLAVNHGLSGTLVGNGHPVPELDTQKIEPPVVLWLASLKAWKRPELFCYLAAACGDLDCQFWLVGRPSDEAVTKRVTGRLDALPNAEYKGGCDIEESNDYLARASLFVNTSKNEGFPNTFIQAWFRETPVVSLEVDPDGVLAEGEVGAKADSPAALESLVRDLIEDDARRLRLGEQARAYAIEQHDIRRVVNRVEEALVGRVTTPETEEVSEAAR